MQARRCVPYLPALLALAAVAQEARRPLTHQDYASWRSIHSPILSRDGRYAAYALFPQEGDGEVVVREIATGKERRESAGELPPPPAPDPALPPGEQPRVSVHLTFTADGRFLAASTFPPSSETERARKEKKKPEEMPKGGLVIIDVVSGAAARISNVKSFQIPEKGGDRLAYLKEPPLSPPAGTEKTKDSYGSELRLRELARPEPDERAFPDVIEYTLSKDGNTLVYAVSSKTEQKNGVYAVAAGTGAAPAVLLAGKGKYVKLAWDRTQNRLAFLSDRDEAGAKHPRFSLYLWGRTAEAASQVVSSATPGCRPGFALSEYGPVRFSRDGSRLFAGCALPAAEKDADPAPGEEKAVMDLWRWNDDYIRPMQKVLAGRERKRTYSAVYHIATKRFLQLGGPDLETVVPSDSGRFAIGIDDRAYRRMVDFDGAYADYYAVDTSSGERKLLVERFRSGFPAENALQWAPDGRHALYFRDRQWRVAGIPGGVSTNLSGGLGVPFYNEDDDRPEPPGSYGTAGWTRDGKSVLLYDRFDIWRVSADGQTASNLTEGYGRREGLQFRVVRLGSDDQEPPGIDLERPLLLRAENLQNRDTGFFRIAPGSAHTLGRLRLERRNFRAIAKAKDADAILLTASTFREFPDLEITDSSFRELRRISNANPQQERLRWGAAELIRYRNADGVPLQAVLFKPDDFDASKKYPMLVYIYERLSQTLNNFVDPKPGTSINAAYYVSNGYLVLMPDIVYTVGAPGQSAVKCVLPAVDAVVERGFVNERAIGIQGHSWGGYQTAYLLTQTNRFRAAEAGAPVGDMISAYNGIRWGPGLPRQFQYEQSQSRIGGSLWQYPLRFVENSPIFQADRIRTPLLMLHDDQDDAVPWYQGIELFLSLRRLGKEVYLFNYNGEFHGLRKRVNQKDYTVRMQQFFDHFLKGAPAPEWMRPAR